MKSSAVLKELNKLRKLHREQNFVFSYEQQKRYDELMQLRRERVEFMYNNDMVV